MPSTREVLADYQPDASLRAELLAEKLLTGVGTRLAHTRRVAERARLADWLAGKMREGEEPPSVGEARAAYALSELHMTLEEYWAFEAASSQRHEFLNGAVYAMSGASVAHNQITFRLAQALSKRLRGGPRRVFLSDLKLRLELGEDQIIYYPDVMVACEP